MALCLLMQTTEDYASPHEPKSYLASCCYSYDTLTAGYRWSDLVDRLCLTVG